MNSCSVCGNSNFVPYYRPRVDLNLMVCSVCAVVVLDVGDDADRYVFSMEKQFFSDEFIDSHDWFQRWLSCRTAARRLEEISRFAKSGDLLEIGPGAGEFLLAAQRQGFRCFALDTSEALVKHIVSAFDIEAQVGSFQDLPLLGRRYDVVVMSHVLEHCVNPIRALRLLHPVLHMDSMIYIAVPNLASWPAWFSGWKSYLPYHLYYFTPKTLLKVLATSGFKASTVSTYQDVPGWAVTLARSGVKRTHLGALTFDRHSGAKKKRSRMLLDIWNAGTMALGYVLTPLRLLQSLLYRGDELIVIAHRQTT